MGSFTNKTKSSLRNWKKYNLHSESLMNAFNGKFKNFPLRYLLFSNGLPANKAIMFSVFVLADQYPMKKLSGLELIVF